MIHVAGFSQQVLPADGAKITQTSVLFEVPEVVGAISYVFKIESSEGNLIELTDDNHVLRIDGLSFGESYHWRVIALDSIGNTLHSYHQQFEIKNSSIVDPKMNRFPVLNYDGRKTLEGLLFLDYSRVAVNREGIPVWYLPELEALDGSRLRDLKLTSRGTVTFLDGFRCEELSLDGVSLWEAPSTGAFSGDTADYYHHEFTRLSNGNYLVLGKQYVPSDLVIDGREIKTLPLSIIIEYSPEGEVIWTWSSDRYVMDSDILEIGQKVGMGNTFGHMNSFYFDEFTGIIYAGFRDLNCILAIEKESGDVLQSYGDKIPSDTTTQGIGFFRKQHASIKLSGDRLLLFNNNDRNKTSSVQIISEVTATNTTSEILWEFFCDFDTLRPSESARMGNALMIENEHIIVNTGRSARIFEVTPNKQVVWQCLPEKWNESKQTWDHQPNYRAFYASSLYPYYHTVSLRDKCIRISNEGSEDDRYILTAYLKPRKRKKVSTLEFGVSKGQSVDFQFQTIVGRKFKSKTLFVEVVSKNNPDLVVERSYLVR